MSILRGNDEFTFSSRDGAISHESALPIASKTTAINEATMKVFVSYSHRDEKFLDALERHCSLLRSQGLISFWHDRKILPGEEWDRKIDEELELASIILLMVSENFMASDYCSSKEMSGL